MLTPYKGGSRVPIHKSRVPKHDDDDSGDDAPGYNVPIEDMIREYGKLY